MNGGTLSRSRGVSSLPLRAAAVLLVAAVSLAACSRSPSSFDEEDPSWAQTSAAELSKEAANPLADLISLPFQTNTDFGLGDFDRTRNILDIQPVVPLADGKIITRTTLPVAWLPDLAGPVG